MAKNSWFGIFLGFFLVFLFSANTALTQDLNPADLSKIIQNLSPEQKAQLQKEFQPKAGQVSKEIAPSSPSIPISNVLEVPGEDISSFLTSDRLAKIEKELIATNGQITFSLIKRLAKDDSFAGFTEEELIKLVINAKEKLLPDLQKILNTEIIVPGLTLDSQKFQVLSLLLRKNDGKISLALLEQLKTYPVFQGLNDEQLILLALKAQKFLTSQPQPGLFKRYTAGKGPQAPLQVDTNLFPFGYELFKRSSIPLPYKPVSPDYLIGPGDEIHVLLWGRINQEYTLEVQRDGTIFLPQIGQFMVSGMRYDQMQSFLVQQIRRITGTKAAVTLGKLRGIQVFVLGEVKNPGVYNVTPMCTMVDALLMAGGPTTIGSLRKIQLKRRGKVISTLDLYDLLLKGDKSHDKRLRQDDIVFVPPVGPLVAISGEVKRPAVYELKGPTNLWALLKLAGGPLPSAYLQHVQVERFLNHTKQIVVDLDAKDKAKLAAFLLQDGDFVKVFSVVKEEKNVVYLLGNVRHPGPYAYRKGMHVSDLIRSPDDLLPDTFLEYGLIKRQVPPDNHWEYRTFSLQAVLKHPDAASDPELKPRDTVLVYNKWDMMTKKWVTVNGAVNKPGRYEFLPHMRVSDLIALAGGLTRYAYLKEAEVVRRVPSSQGMKTRVIHINLQQALAGDPTQDLSLEEEDTLLVRSVPEWQKPMVVEITGEVRFPGKYVIRRGERLSSVLKRAGGYTKEAYLPGAVFTREKLKELQQRQITEMINRLEKELFASGAQETSAAINPQEAQIKAEELKAKKAFLARLRQIKPQGRLVIHLKPLAELEGSPDDIELEDGDQLYIPKNPHTVQVVGAVYNQAAFVYRPGADVSYYLALAGGFTKMADKKDLYILKVDGTAVRPNRYALSFRWDREDHRWERSYAVALQPGDTIVVPTELEKVLWMRNVKDITQILYQIAVTAGVLIAAY